MTGEPWTVLAVYSQHSNTNLRATMAHPEGCSMGPLSTVRSILQRTKRIFLQTRDRNFIGFDKYRREGGYHWIALECSPDYQKKVSMVKDLLAPEAEVLDIGCGDGAFLYALAPFCRRIVGIDADYDAFRIAEAKLRHLGIRNAECYQSPISRLTRERLRSPSGFDLVYSIDVLEHLPEPHELLRSCLALTRSGGKVLIGTPLFLSTELISPYHVREFTVIELRSLLGEYFRIESEQVLPQLRLDGQVHEAGFYMATCLPIAEPATARAHRNQVQTGEGR
jgi:2-polyprenyl-3-methyl-5-hydroxy-6-metoxy-1,4-benzoquinol methylase